MSLEAALAENTAALKALTEATLASAAGRAEALAAVTGEAAPKATRGRQKADAVAAAAQPKLTIDDVRGAFAGFMAVDDETEKAARVAIVKDIFTKLGVAKAADIPAEKFRVAIDYIEEAKNADPAPPEASDEDLLG